MSLDKAQVREQRKAYLTLNRLEAEERRSMTFADRWARFAAMEALMRELGVPNEARGNEEVAARWVRIKGKVS